MSNNKASAADTAPQITSLNGIRFFAVFHIFLYHLWSARNEGDFTKGPMANVYAGLDALPHWLNNFIAHGYLSTSFFFLLSGFILAYLYWAPGGELATSPRRFWWTRFTRIFPIHLVVLLITALLTLPRFWFDPAAPSVALAVGSFITTATLTQAWIPPFVPIWSWPTWALSAIVFLYLIMPALMRWLARLSRGQQLGLLIAMPLISLLPTLVFLQFFPDGAKGQQNWQIFLGSNPLFWVPQFAAGMLLSRVFGLSRFETAWRDQPKRWFALGDLALLAVIALSITEPHTDDWRHILRHGALMPLYLVVIHDFALGRGIAARFFSLPGMNFLGQTSFSIFIWQNLMMIISFMVAYITGNQAASLPVAIFGVLGMSILSTYLIEKPWAKRLRRRIDSPAVTTSVSPSST
jgi:peptidoglycan/LPS O-acetylase OafA/YrhL